MLPIIDDLAELESRKRILSSEADELNSMWRLKLKEVAEIHHKTACVHLQAGDFKKAADSLKDQSRCLMDAGIVSGNTHSKVWAFLSPMDIKANPQNVWAIMEELHEYQTRQ